jgi:DNA-binding MarR family transcriptional regulator
VTTHPEAARSLAESVARLRALTAQINQQVERDLGLTVPQVQALDAVAAGAQKVGAVAQRAGAHVSSASRAVDQLVRAGLVSRINDPHDRRAVALALTPAGRERLERLAEVRIHHLSECLAGFAESEALTFAALFDRFAAGVERSLLSAEPG